MSVRLPFLIAVWAVAFVSVPRSARAQECNPTDAAAHTCFIAPTPSQATVTGANIGFGGGFPVQVAAKYLGGIALFQSDIYFFQGFFGAGFNPLNPLAQIADYTLIGGKPYGSGVVNGPSNSGWIPLSGSYASTQELVFGIRVRGDGVGDRWYYSGYGAYGYDRNSLGRNSQPGGPGFTPIYSYLFLGGAAPESDGTFNSNPALNFLRPGSPPAWSAAWQSGNRYFASGTVDALLGFEDNQGWSDGDFNDGLIALDFSTVPEPSSVALVAIGLVALATAARRRRNS